MEVKTINNNNRKKKLKAKFKLPKSLKYLLYIILLPIIILPFKDFDYFMIFSIRLFLLGLIVFSISELIHYKKRNPNDIKKAIFIILFFILFNPLNIIAPILDYPNAIFSNYRTIEGTVTDVDFGRFHFNVYIKSMNIDFITPNSIEVGEKYKINYLPISKIGIKKTKISN